MINAIQVLSGHHAYDILPLGSIMVCIVNSHSVPFLSSFTRINDGEIPSKNAFHIIVTPVFVSAQLSDRAIERVLAARRVIDNIQSTNTGRSSCFPTQKIIYRFSFFQSRMASIPDLECSNPPLSNRMTSSTSVHTHPFQGHSLESNVFTSLQKRSNEIWFNLIESG